MKTIYKILSLSTAFLGFMFCLSSCSDFFDPKTDDVLSGDDYLSEETEIYTGFLGIVTKMQAIGDKAILLTDTRGELLEPTDESISELISIYNYDDDLKGNKYADPAAYYDVVIACNDYIDNMFEFKKNYPELVKEEHFNCLISSTIRVKTWIYLTLAEIYGEALWFDDPMIQVQDLSDAKFKKMDIDGVVDACLTLLTTGVQGIDGTLTFSWYEWLDPETDLAESEYRYWDYMVPPYEGLYAKLCLWKGAALTASGADATSYYQEAFDILINVIDAGLPTSSTSSQGFTWLRDASWTGNFARIWDYPTPYPRESVSAIIYDYTRNQTNTLLKHFSDEYPNDYLLRPSQTGMDRFSDDTFNPGGAASDNRAGVTFRQRNGRYYISKFRPSGSTRRTYAYQDDVHIYIFRGAEYHFMMAEALNNLGRFNEAASLINNGMNAYSDSACWYQWTNELLTKYPNIGIRGTFGLGVREFKTVASEAGMATAKEWNDKALADEMLLEFPCEGKIYPALIRFAKRWKDNSIIADRVCPKYGAKAETIRGKIMSGGYFVPWDL